jgi:predicted Na+-dependent transporter
MINILTVVTLFEMTVAMGLELRFAQIVEVAKDWRLILRAELVNFVVYPAAVVAVLLVVEHVSMAAVGLILLAGCPAAHYAMPFTKFAKGSLAAAAGLLVILAASGATLAAPVRAQESEEEQSNEEQSNEEQGNEEMAKRSFLPWSLCT